AAIQRILAIGGDSYAQLGSESSTGTKLLSLDAGFNRPGIVEVEMGLPLRQVIDEIAMGFKQSTKAIHIGGPLGGLVPVSKIDDLSVDFESFSEHGFLLGHASFVCIPDSFSMMRYLEHLFEFTRDESCGKCFPCRLGSTRGKEMFSQALKGEKLLDRNLLDDLLTTMQHGSLCALGGGLPLPVWNALMYFEDELSAYFENINGQPGDRL
ncbi:MAG TPA: NADH-ubiquinone oxidoreductase-F iron-sulfur binding region domain-containing protein, partial [Pseudomonadales bacterium]|nr:NADH-ubiquinone oxidoreductase-F iron-sulfur binding region domain-containing protein [Pseudomonadales bacterium]